MLILSWSSLAPLSVGCLCAFVVFQRTERVWRFAEERACDLRIPSFHLPKAQKPAIKYISRVPILVRRLFQKQSWDKVAEEMLPHFFAMCVKSKREINIFFNLNFHWCKRLIRPWRCSGKCLHSDDCFAEMLKISSRFLASSIVLPVDVPRDTCSKIDRPALLASKIRAKGL